MTDADLVREESLDAVDLMVAASGNYESNLVMAAYLKSRGVTKTIALTASSDFDDVARKLGVDVAVPMRDTVVDCIVSHFRGDNVKSIHAVCNRFFEIVECEVSPSSRAAGKSLSQLVNDGEFLVLLVQETLDGEYSMPNGSTVITPGARVVLVVKAGANEEVQMFTGKA
jgi:trk system potassium uptake protein TrkA